MLRPSELLNALLLEEVFCELEERDFGIKSSKFFPLLSVSVPCDFVRDFIRDVPNEENKTRDYPRREIKKLKKAGLYNSAKLFQRKHSVQLSLSIPAKDFTNNSN